MHTDTPMADPSAPPVMEKCNAADVKVQNVPKDIYTVHLYALNLYSMVSRSVTPVNEHTCTNQR